ncbi:unnamed protein product [Onchocerca flexuosa]|uniref:Uncharacterized protein n=1 Tax=Onchocerca flexuosa TaxID=387005 RepID=A0A183HUT2_9BILA|nr:unnamed protein product [Onchocerca flexuosa]
MIIALNEYGSNLLIQHFASIIMLITFLSPYLLLSLSTISYDFRLFARKVVEFYFSSHICYALFLSLFQLFIWRMP